MQRKLSDKMTARIKRKQATEMGTIHSSLAASLVQAGSGQ